MRKTLVTLLLLAGAVCTYAQDVAELKSKLVGEWVFDTMVLTEEASEEEKSKLEMMNNIMKNVSMFYQEDGRYLMDGFGKKEEGNWSIEEPGTHIKFLNDKGQENNIEFKFDENGMLHTTVGSSGAAMRLMRPEESSEISVSAAPGPPEVVKTTVKELSKKWYMVSRIKANGETISETALALMAGTYIDFKEDGTYSMHLMIMDEEGTWTFDEESSKLVYTANGESKVWHVVGISETELKLIQGSKGDTFIYSTTSPKEE